MRHDAREERIGLRSLLVGVGVERVARGVGELGDLVQAHFAQLGADRVANVQRAQVLPERVLAFGLEREVTVSARVPDARDGGEHVG
ncbi:hypothetical protein D9M72_322280 [compost metagenome]